MGELVTGGCLCGAVRYEFSADPVLSEHCYCRDCQRVTGAAMGSLMFVPKAAFRLTKGDLKFFAVRANSQYLHVERAEVGANHTWAPQVRQDAQLAVPESLRAQLMSRGRERDALLASELVEYRPGFA